MTAMTLSSHYSDHDTITRKGPATMSKRKKSTGSKLAKAAYHLSGASITLGATKAVAKAPLIAAYPLLPHKTPANRRNHGRWS